MRNILTIIISAFILMHFVGCKTKDAEIVILCVNDTHGSVDNYAKLSAYFKQKKAENPNTFLFCNGDIFSGNPLIDQYPERGFPAIDLMNKTGFMLSSLGNHEFDYGQTELKARIKQANFPFISANTHVKNGAEIDHVEPYHIFKTDNGLKIAVLGLVEISSGGKPSTHPDKLQNIDFTDPVKTAQEYKSLRENNVFIILSHCGLDTDIILSGVMPEADVILGGHSHTKIEKEMFENNVLITQASAYLRYFSEVHISIKDGKVVNRSAKLIDFKSLDEEDAEIKSTIEKYKANDPGKKVIGYTNEAIEGKQKLGSLMTDAITYDPEFDIAFQNVGGIRMQKIEKGDITINTAYMLDPFGNELIKIKMSVEEIEALIVSSVYKNKGEPDLMASGITYTVNTKNKKVELLDNAGKPLDREKKYSVGMNSYIYSKYEFKHADPGASAGVKTSDMLIKYIEVKKELNYSGIPDRCIVVK